MEPPALLTDTERAAWLNVPVARYGEQGVAAFRDHLRAVAEARRSEDHLPHTEPAADDCDGEP